MTDLALSPAAGVGVAKIVDRAVRGIPRSLYLYENIGAAPSLVDRALYLYENVGVTTELVARALYLYENVGAPPVAVAARALYLYEATRDGEAFPWLMRINPTEQYPGGTVSLYGDGFGELLEAAAGATITTDSVSGANVGGNVVDRAIGSWLSTGGAAAWIRFTFGAPKTIVAIALEAAAAGWGTPVFKFSDGGGDVTGGSVVPAGTSILSEYPVGTKRALYTLPAPRTTDYVEIRTQAGPGAGLYEVWILEDLDDAAEGAGAILNNGLVSETALGTATWQNRSPGLWPANGGLPITPAAVVTIPANAESGLVVVEETA